MKDPTSIRLTAPAVLAGQSERPSGAAPSNVQATEVLVEPSPVPEVSELIAAAGQHLMLCVVVGLSVALGLGYVAWSVVPASYEASSFVHVRSHSDTGGSSSQSRAEDAAFARAQIARVTEQPVLAAALRRSELTSLMHEIPEREAVEWLRERVRVKLPGGSEVMTVAVQHPSPQVALAFNSAITGAYLDDYRTSLNEDRRRKREELETAAREADRVLGEHWQQLHTAAEQVGSGTPEQLTVRDEIQLQGYRDYAQRLRAAQLHGNQLRSELAEEQLQREQSEQQTVEVPAAVVEERLLNHPQVASLRQRVQAAEARLREVEAIASRDDSPRIRRLQEDRDHYAAELQELTESLRPRLREQLQLRSTEGRGERVTQIQKEIERNADEVAFLRDMLAQLESQIRRTGSDSSVRLEMIRHNIDRQSKLADSLWQSLERLKIESLAGPRVSLIESARLPESPNRGKQWKTASAAAMAGLMISILSIGYVEWRSCRVRHPRDVLLRTRLALFGTGSFATGLPTLWRLRHARRDPLDSGVHEVAAHLMLRSVDRDRLPSVLVFSATEGEPRHVVAAELARSLAAAGYCTLLIDADFSSSRLTRAHQLEQRPGLARWGDQGVEASNEAASRWLPTSDRRLWILPSGVEHRSSGDGHRPSRRGLSAASALAAMLDEDLERFQAIVVCGPAALTNPESVLLASRVDQSVMAMMLGRSRWNLLSAAHHRMAFAGISVLGAVLHVAPSQSRGDQLQVSDAEPPDNESTATTSAGRRVANPAMTEALETVADELGDSEEASLQQGVQSLRDDLRQATTSKASSTPVAATEATTLEVPADEMSDPHVPDARVLDSRESGRKA